MSLANPPKFLGMITIVENVNDQITWFEQDNLGATATLTCVLTPGDYYFGKDDSEVGSLAAHIKAKMDAASDAGAVGAAHMVGPVPTGIDYSLTLSDTTGQMSINCDAPWGNPSFYPIITHAAATDKALCGGDPGATFDGHCWTPLPTPICRCASCNSGCSTMIRASGFWESSGCPTPSKAFLAEGFAITRTERLTLIWSTA